MTVQVCFSDRARTGPESRGSSGVAPCVDSPSPCWHEHQLHEVCLHVNEWKPAVAVAHQACSDQSGMFPIDQTQLYVCHSETLGCFNSDSKPDENCLLVALPVASPSPQVFGHFFARRRRG